MTVDDEVTGVTVCYNTKEILKKAIDSIRSFHPGMKLIIVDGSDKTNDCYKYVCSLPDERTRVFHVDFNIGHGRGLALGISFVDTPFFLTFDSDIEMLKSPLQVMLEMMEDDTYGVGYTEPTDLGGHDFGVRPDWVKYGSMKYMHPYFSLIQLKEYKKYNGFIHHGAPAVNTMLQLHRMGIADKVLKEFPGLGHSAGQPIGGVANWKAEPREFIKHDRDGTRISIQGDWDAVIDPLRPKITCITPTGDRPEAFYFTRKWIFSQTMPPDQWLVIDDGFVPLTEKLKTGLDYVRRTPKLGEGHTLTLNMAAALPHIKGDFILIIEDDDWYGPTYIETMVKHLLDHDLVGEGCARYYHVPAGKYRRLDNREHASFCQTGFTRKMLSTFQNCIPGDPYIDMRLWAAANGNGFVFTDVEDKLHLHCSLKGLKGRKGIGTGHNRNEGYYYPDKKYQQLIKWVGKENAKAYVDHVGMGIRWVQLYGGVS